ncbi:MAG: hypothetical protein WCX28_05760, partial [Bacteriovoracaceae bacterium]
GGTFGQRPRWGDDDLVKVLLVQDTRVVVVKLYLKINIAHLMVFHLYKYRPYRQVMYSMESFDLSKRKKSGLAQAVS